MRQLFSAIAETALLYSTQSASVFFQVSATAGAAGSAFHAFVIASGQIASGAWAGVLFAIPTVMYNDVLKMNMANRALVNIFNEEDSALESFNRLIEEASVKDLTIVSDFFNKIWPRSNSFDQRPWVDRLLNKIMPYRGIMFKVHRAAKKDISTYTQGQYKVGYCKQDSIQNSDQVRATIFNAQRREGLKNVDSEIRRIKQLGGIWVFDFLYDKTKEKVYLQNNLSSENAKLKAMSPETYCFTRQVR